MLRGVATSSRCRHVCFSGQLEQWTNPLGSSTFKRFRSTGQKKRGSKSKTSFRQSSGIDGQPQKHDTKSNLHWHPFPLQGRVPVKPTKKILEEQVISYFQRRVKDWSHSRAFQRQLRSYGLLEDDIQPLLIAFRKAVELGELSGPREYELYGLSRFSQDFSEAAFTSETDAIFSTILFAWASNPQNASKLSEIISPSTLQQIRALVQAADCSHPEEEFPLARSLRRKIIMHVGPTNSGKTHNALRALAAAPTGVYAGPLRLLAHEIWERLNLGQIVPLGVEDGAVVAKPPTPDSNTALDVPPNDQSIRIYGNPAHARECNMLTGEEQKIVNTSAGLLSCTVEMLPFGRVCEVAVIDEIQMMGDPDRGSGWTRAVLGMPAKEVHLCGEETAVPLIQELVKATGDELIINRHQRLTPLAVEENSLDGKLKDVKKGDCIVTFRRESIFALKARIEAQTPMRCAVVYGRLPPETRSEQAALFNDPDSGYDVLIGSDAIGMGLNLKIRRIIFETVHKFDGVAESHLSISQTKQIAGRAGRFGLLGKDNKGGLVTTLLKNDLPFVRKTMAKSLPDIVAARIYPTTEMVESLASVLPKDSSTETVFSAGRYITIPPPIYRFQDISRAQQWFCKFVDQNGPGLTVKHRLSYMSAPLPKPTEIGTTIMARLIQMQDQTMDVRFMEVLGDSDFAGLVETVEGAMKETKPPRNVASILRSMEALHKVIVTYVWLSFRQPVVFHQHAEVVDLKRRVEKALDWLLQVITRDLPSDQLRLPHASRPKISHLSRIDTKLTVLKEVGADLSSNGGSRDLDKLAVGSAN